MFEGLSGSGAGRRRREVMLLLALITWSLIATSAESAGRLLKIRNEGDLRYIKSSGSQLIDEGRTTGTIPGTARVRFTYNGDPLVRAQFTIYGRYGTISGQATGRLHNSASTTPSLRGTLSITGGSGRYAHAGGSGELFGVFSRRNYGLTVQAIVSLRY